MRKQEMDALEIGDVVMRHGLRKTHYGLVTALDRTEARLEAVQIHFCSVARPVWLATTALVASHFQTEGLHRADLPATAEWR